MKYEQHTRKSISAELRQFCYFAKEFDDIEVTEWTNGEGYDIDFENKHLSLTSGQIQAIVTLKGMLDAS